MQNVAAKNFAVGNARSMGAPVCMAHLAANWRRSSGSSCAFSRAPAGRASAWGRRYSTLSCPQRDPGCPSRSPLRSRAVRSRGELVASVAPARGRPGCTTLLIVRRLSRMGARRTRGCGGKAHWGGTRALRRGSTWRRDVWEGRGGDPWWGSRSPRAPREISATIFSCGFLALRPPQSCAHALQHPRNWKPSQECSYLFVGLDCLLSRPCRQRYSCCLSLTVFKLSVSRPLHGVIAVLVCFWKVRVVLRSMVALVGSYS